jgi:hypothetical protein
MITHYQLFFGHLRTPLPIKGCTIHPHRTIYTSTKRHFRHARIARSRATMTSPSTGSATQSRMLFCTSKDGAALPRVTPKIWLHSSLPHRFDVSPFGPESRDDSL